MRTHYEYALETNGEQSTNAASRSPSQEMAAEELYGLCKLQLVSSVIVRANVKRSVSLLYVAQRRQKLSQQCRNWLACVALTQSNLA
jgi:hypothetical protein